MDPKTDLPGPAPAIEAFYDRLAPDYDAMTSPGKRVDREQPFFRELVTRHGIRSAVDAGCGTGFHALLLAGLGVDVTAIDLSGEMLRRLGEKAAERNVRITTVRADLHSLAQHVAGSVDAVVCMGNTLAHQTDRGLLRRTLEGFASVLRPGGVLVIQLLNYAKILARGERVQSVREEGESTFVRFYDFTEHLLRFNILRLERRGGGIVPHLSSVDLRPILLPELEGVFGQTGFASWTVFGDITGAPFEPASSPDLIVVGVREG